MAHDGADDDPTALATPGETGTLLYDDPERRVVRWDPPPQPGSAPNVVRCDLLRSTDPADFQVSALCLASGTAETSASDPELPGLGGVFHYLVRAGNPCGWGAGVLGARSDGVPRSGRSCP